MPDALHQRCEASYAKQACVMPVAHHLVDRTCPLAPIAFFSPHAHLPSTSVADVINRSSSSSLHPNVSVAASFNSDKSAFDMSACAPLAKQRRTSPGNPAETGGCPVAARLSFARQRPLSDPCSIRYRFPREKHGDTPDSDLVSCPRFLCLASCSSRGYTCAVAWSLQK